MRLGPFRNHTRKAEDGQRVRFKARTLRGHTGHTGQVVTYNRAAGNGNNPYLIRCDCGTDVRTPGSAFEVLK